MVAQPGDSWDVPQDTKQLQQAQESSGSRGLVSLSFMVRATAPTVVTQPLSSASTAAAKTCSRPPCGHLLTASVASAHLPPLCGLLGSCTTPASCIQRKSDSKTLQGLPRSVNYYPVPSFLLGRNLTAVRHHPLVQTAKARVEGVFVQSKVALSDGS